ncbi:MAG: TRAP transporter small permease [Thermodesulfobacteriota bacterium]
MTWTRLGRWLDRLEDFCFGLAGLILAFIIVSVCLEIVMRYGLRSPLTWVIELTEYGLLYLTFLGAPWLLRKGGHVRVDILLIHLNKTWRRRLDIFSSLVGVWISAVLTVFGFITTWDHWIRDIRNVTLLEFPLGAVMAVIPLGSFLLFIRFGRLSAGLLLEAESDPAAAAKGVTP